MAKIEVEDVVLEQLQQAYQLLDKLSRDPKARTHTEKALKEVIPTYLTDEERAQELAQPYVEEVKAVAKTLQERLDAIDTREKETSEAAERNKLETDFADLKSTGYTDDGLEGIKKTMLKYGIIDAKAAARLYEAERPHDPPTTEYTALEPDGFRFEPDAGGKADDWFKNPDAATNRAIAEVLNESRRAAMAT